MTDSFHRKLISSWYMDVEMPGGWKFNHPQMLKMIDLYYNSQYKTGRYDRLGFRKFFYNIVKPTCDIATKFIDLDTRDILLTPEHSNDELRVFLMQRRLKQWLKDTNFGKLLNDITFSEPIYGHVVIKKSNEGWKEVPLQNLRHNPAAKGIVTGSFAELYILGPDEFPNDWDTKELFARGEEEEYVIYDCFSSTNTGWKREVKGDLWTRKKAGSMVRGVESEMNNQGEEYFGSVLLFSEELKKHNYREIKWENVPGRALGRGFVEYLEDNQVARNETENLERKSIAVHSTPIFQTRDEEIAGKNTLTYEPGHILNAQSEVQPVANEARNLPQFQETRQNWDQNTERKTFTSDITTGASLPSRTPLGVANQQAAMASSFFERKREDLGLFIKELLLDDIIPAFKNDTVAEHVMTFSCADEESSWLDEAITEAMIGEKVIQYANSTGWFPSKEQKDLIRMQIKDKLKGKKNRFLRIPDSFWSNAHYMVDIDITGESTDNGVKQQLLQFIVQILGTNPGVLQIPEARSALSKIANLGGISPVELGIYGPPTQAEQAPQVAGSLAKSPSPGGSMQTTQRI